MELSGPFLCFFIFIPSTYGQDHPLFIFDFLTHSVQHDTLQFHPNGSRVQKFILSHRQAVFIVYIYHRTLFTSPGLFPLTGEKGERNRTGRNKNSRNRRSLKGSLAESKADLQAVPLLDPKKVTWGFQKQRAPAVSEQAPELLGCRVGRRLALHSPQALPERDSKHGALRYYAWDLSLWSQKPFPS